LTDLSLIYIWPLHPPPPVLGDWICWLMSFGGNRKKGNMLKFWRYFRREKVLLSKGTGAKKDFFDYNANLWKYSSLNIFCWEYVKIWQQCFICNLYINNTVKLYVERAGWDLAIKRKADLFMVWGRYSRYSTPTDWVTSSVINNFVRYT
jgi:hypothetical protein